MRGWKSAQRRCSGCVQRDFRQRRGAREGHRLDIFLVAIGLVQTLPCTPINRLRSCADNAAGAGSKRYTSPRLRMSPALARSLTAALCATIEAQPLAGRHHDLVARGHRAQRAIESLARS